MLSEEHMSGDEFDSLDKRDNKVWKCPFIECDFSYEVVKQKDYSLQFVQSREIL